MDALRQDLRIALRQLRRSPGFALIAVLTLALGIGATTAIFTVVNTVLLRPLPFPDADRLAVLWERRPGPDGVERNPASPFAFCSWRRQAESFQALEAHVGWPMNLTGVGEPEEVRVGLVTTGFFSILGTGPRLGRALAEDDETDVTVLTVLVGCSLVVGVPGGALAQTSPDARSAAMPTAADAAAIVRAALDYIEGWYAGNAERMERSLHPELAKRIVLADDRGGRDALDHMTAAQLVEGTRRGGGRSTPADERRQGGRILDTFGNAASVRVDASGWVDYMHLGRVDGEWKIINVLWALRPESS